VDSSAAGALEISWTRLQCSLQQTAVSAVPGSHQPLPPPRRCCWLQERLLVRLRGCLRLDVSAEVWPCLRLLFALGSRPSLHQQSQPQKPCTAESASAMHALCLCIRRRVSELG